MFTVAFDQFNASLLNTNITINEHMRAGSMGICPEEMGSFI